MTAIPKPVKRVKARKPLRAKHWGIKANPAERRRRRARSGREDLEFLAAVRRLPCCVCGAPAEPHHAGRRPGMSIKCGDWETIPMCRTHHQAIERDQPPFRGWSQERRFAWIDRQIAATQRRVATMLGRDVMPDKPKEIDLDLHLDPETGKLSGELTITEEIAGRVEITADLEVDQDGHPTANVGIKIPF